MGSAISLPWSSRLTDDRTEHPDVAHPDHRCHSCFDCLTAQRRQHEMYHREGWEVFYDGRHGSFPGSEDLVSVEGPGGGCDLVPDGDIDRSLFLLNRGKVRQEALNLIRRASAHRCPLFLLSYFDQQIKKLPAMVEIGTTPGWRFLECSVYGSAVAWECY
jgi:hypothetical protein